MKRSIVAVLLSLALSGAAVGSVGAAPAPSYAAVLTVDSACVLTLKATWRNTSVDTVFGIWYLDEAYVFSSQAPFTGPNGGTLKGRTATMHAGPGTPDSVTHTWRVLVQFYRGGAALNDTNATVDANCTI